MSLLLDIAKFIAAGVLMYVAILVWIAANVAVCLAVSLVPVLGTWWPAYVAVLGAFNVWLWRVLHGRPPLGGSAPDLDGDPLTDRPPLDPSGPDW